MYRNSYAPRNGPSPVVRQTLRSRVANIFNFNEMPGMGMHVRAREWGGGLLLDAVTFPTLQQPPLTFLNFLCMPTCVRLPPHVGVCAIKISFFGSHLLLIFLGMFLSDSRYTSNTTMENFKGLNRSSENLWRRGAMKNFGGGG